MNLDSPSLVVIGARYIRPDYADKDCEINLQRRLCMCATFDEVRHGRHGMLLRVGLSFFLVVPI